jgi:hypothetical protein
MGRGNRIPFRTIARGAALALMAALAGCTGLDRSELSRFYPVASDEFEYLATTNLFYAARDDGWAEGERLHWLGTFVSRYGLCPKGYEIESRRAIVRYQSPLGYPVDDIVYRGHCRA